MFSVILSTFFVIALIVFLLIGVALVIFRLNYCIERNQLNAKTKVNLAIIIMLSGCTIVYFGYVLWSIIFS